MGRSWQDLPLRGRVSDRRDDAGIDAAAADIAIHEADDLLWRGMCVFIQQTHSRYDHPAGAVPALHSTSIQEGLLQRMQVTVYCKAFNGCNRLRTNVTHRGNARPRRFAVEQHGTSTALSFATAVLCSGQFQLVAQYAQQ